MPKVSSKLTQRLLMRMTICSHHDIFRQLFAHSKFSSYICNKYRKMCQTAIISRSIEHLGRKSFDRRMRIVSPLYSERKGDLTRICNQLSNLCEMLHTDFSTITKEDYAVFGPELKVLISTLKDLYSDSKKTRLLHEDNERLREHIQDLEELDHDIKCYRLKLQNNPSVQSAMSSIGKLDFSRFVNKP